MADTEGKRISVALAILASVVGMLLAKPMAPAGEQIYAAATTSAGSVSAQVAESDGR